jgi:hypothetical protein
MISVYGRVILLHCYIRVSKGRNFGCIVFLLETATWPLDFAPNRCGLVSAGILCYMDMLECCDVFGYMSQVYKFSEECCNDVAFMKMLHTQEKLLRSGFFSALTMVSTFACESYSCSTG